MSINIFKSVFCIVNNTIRNFEKFQIPKNNNY